MKDIRARRVKTLMIRQRARLQGEDHSIVTQRKVNSIYLISTKQGKQDLLIIAWGRKMIVAQTRAKEGGDLPTVPQKAIVERVSLTKMIDFVRTGKECDEDPLMPPRKTIIE